MQRFNLSKFYTLNWLLWASLIGNIILLVANLRKFIIYKEYGGWLFFYTEVTFSFLLIIFIFILISAIVELILRKTKKITRYNTLTMPKITRIIIYWFSLFLIPVDFFIFYISLSIMDYILNGP